MTRVGARPLTINLALVGPLAIAGCGITPQQSIEASLPAVAANAMSEVYVYPARGQGEAQLDRDRYECHLWAVRQSRFDPSLPVVPVVQPAASVPAGPPPGAGVATGVVTGAVIGAAVAGSGDSAEGALVGAAAGAVLGAVADNTRSAQMQSVAGVAAEQDPRAANYRRAISACLDGRGYAVR